MTGPKLADVIPLPVRGAGGHQLAIRLRRGLLAVTCTCLPAGVHLAARASWPEPAEYRRIWTRHTLEGIRR